MVNLFKKSFRFIQLGFPFFGTLIAIVFSEAFKGIVGNRADDLFVNASKYIPSFLLADFTVNDTIIIKVWLLLIFFTSLVPTFIAYSHFSRAHKVAIEFNKSDELLIVMLQRFMKGCKDNTSNCSLEEREQTIVDKRKRLGEKFLDSNLRAFSLYHRECNSEVYLIDPQDPEYLYPWCHSTNIHEFYSPDRCYCGPLESEHDHRKNFIGKCFSDRNIDIAQIEKGKNYKRWVTKNRNFKFYHGQDDEPNFPFRSQIAVPISVSKSEEVLGVLTMYCKDKDIFDDNDVKALVSTIAIRLASFMEISKCL